LSNAGEQQKAEMPSHLGRYEIVRELGKGAMGVVYEGYDPKLNRCVAIKTARKDVMEASGMAEEMMERFVREAQATGVLDHRNIITIYDAGQEGDIAFIAMEFLEGGDLRDVIEGRRKLHPREVAEIGATVCDALDMAHLAGIVHRDIKPANIMTPRDKPIKLTDFGIAHVTDSNLTQDGALVGTPHYMSPEQFMGQKLDGRSDLFSVGVLLYELLTGQKPFAGEALTTVMHQVLKITPPEPRSLSNMAETELSRVVMKAISKRPQDRYQRGRDMAAALRESIKAFPDPVVLGFAPAPSEPLKPEDELAGSDTILDGLDPGLIDSGMMDTLVSRRTADLDRTVNPEHDATVELPARPAKEAVQGAQAEQRSKRAYAIVGVVAGLLLVVGIGWGLLGGGAEEGGAVVQVPVEAHVTQDSGVWQAFSEFPDSVARAEYLDEQARAGTVEPLAGGTIQAVDGDSGDMLDEETLDASGEGGQLLDIEGTHESVKFVVTATVDGSEVREEFLVRSPEAWGTRQVFLLLRGE
jgi:serine/threonine-protein kinase